MATNNVIAEGKTVKYVGVIYTIVKQVRFGDKDYTRLWECKGAVIVRTLRMMRRYLPLNSKHTHIQVITLSEKQILASWKKDEPIRQPQSVATIPPTIKAKHLPDIAGRDFFERIRASRKNPALVAA